MNTVINDNHENVEMRFEGLFISVTKCKQRYQDPWSFANKDIISKTDNYLKTKRALSIIITKLVFDYWSEKETTEKLIELDNRVWVENISYNDLSKIIDELIELYKKK